MITGEKINLKLLDLQNDYLDNGNQKSWSDLWLLSVEICRRMIWIYLKKTGCWLAPETSVEDKAIEAVIYVFRRYTTRPGYRINRAFISALRFGVTHALFYRTKENRAYSAAWRFSDPRSMQLSTDMILDKLLCFEDTIHR